MKKRDNVQTKLVAKNGQIIATKTAQQGDREMELSGVPVPGYVYELSARYRYLNNDIIGAQRYFGCQELDPIGLAQSLEKEVARNPAPAHHLGVVGLIDVRYYLNGRAQQGVLLLQPISGESLEPALAAFRAWAEDFEPLSVPKPKPTKMLAGRLPRFARI